ncbi:RT0821/Lpp0805 family surface protein [Roseibium suaedae]|uniref:Outer membrane surface antigen n=1 Tax=Roseibium suaedae TaxID=735517 RepID=A0A1M7B9K7_9HYPH|nr:RT0821/Lpp0805 family surface protein [Roseibium suaedae]SHL51623.1 outer membrane surface antigen [Roseibium suaedae]
MFHRVSYDAVKTKFQKVRFAPVALACVLAGCGQVSMPLGSNDVETPLVLTGSIPSSSDVAFADIGETDREIIAMSIDQLVSGTGMEASALADEGTMRTAVSWTNPDSGNSGSIAKLDKSKLDDTGCLDFETTANTIAGIRLYKGTACRDIRQVMAITALTVSGA